MGRSRINRGSEGSLGILWPPPVFFVRHSGVYDKRYMNEAEVTCDLHVVLAKAQQGVEVIIEQDYRAVAVLKASNGEGPGHKLSQCIALAKAYEKKLGCAPVPDADFATDVHAAIDSRLDRFEALPWE